jgi:D-alanyl-lipoteichoic acid acyltransferase DltB (MBOAT superfamily)
MPAPCFDVRVAGVQARRDPRRARVLRIAGSPMPFLAPLLETLRLVVEGRAGFLARFILACGAYTVLALAVRGRSHAVRATTLAVGSVALLCVLTTPLVTLALVLNLVALWVVVERLPAGRPRTALAIALVALQEIAPIWWLPLLPDYAGRVREFTAFATNLTFLRAWGYTYDRLRRPEPVPPSLLEYSLFTFFLPAFVNGPIVSLDEFRRRWRDGFATAGSRKTIGIALGRIAWGVVLTVVTMYWVCVQGTAHYEAAVRGGTLHAWFHAVRVYFCWYLSFSAWTEIAIGFGLLAGVRLPENFEAPHFAYGSADFFRRWNMTLVGWLRSYVYLPLGGALLRGRDGRRYWEWRNTAAVFVVMILYHLVGGLKLLGPGYLPHLSYVPWTLWGVTDAAAVLATRHMKPPRTWTPARVAVVAATFLFACLGHMTVMFPPGMPVHDLWIIYGHLVGR